MTAEQKYGKGHPTDSLSSSTAGAQSGPRPFSTREAFDVFSEYSPEEVLRMCLGEPLNRHGVEDLVYWRERAAKLHTQRDEALESLGNAVIAVEKAADVEKEMQRRATATARECETLRRIAIAEGCVLVAMSAVILWLAVGR